MKIISAMKTRFILWIWNHALTCKEVTRLISQALDKPLTFKQRVQLRLHFLICLWCDRYAKHLRFVHQAAPRYEQEIDVVALQSLSSDARRRVKEALRDKGVA